MIRALVGEIYPEIRMIFIKWNPINENFTLRYLLDRKPIEFDYESISIVSANFYSHLNAIEDKAIKKYIEECIYHPKSSNRLDDLDGFEILYARREYIA